MAIRPDRLEVHLFERLAGTLREAGAELLFRYDPRWLTDAGAIPLSLSLPLQEEPQEARAFFANLLPEGTVREHYARRLRLDLHDDFALLAALGGECAGAVALYPPDEGPPAPGTRPDYRKLSPAELRQLLDEPLLIDSPLLPAGTGLRLSLAGAQDKLPVAVFDDCIHLPLGGAPSTHILKPQHHRFAHLVENEAFCMTLAQRLGLTVPRVTVLQEGGGAYLVERFDRIPMAGGGEIQRLHQEDFCQALGIPHAAKYEFGGGPGYADCFRVLRKAREPLPDQRRLVRLALFNYLIGNADAHAKNLALLYLHGRIPSLAPFYDLVCTEVYPALTRGMAMRLGDVLNPAMVGLAEWEALSRAAGWRSPRYVLESLEELADGALKSAPRLADELARTTGAGELLVEIVRLIRSRAQATLRTLGKGLASPG